MMLTSLMAASALCGALSQDNLALPTRTVLSEGWQVAAEETPGVRPADGAWREIHVPSTFEAVFGAHFDGVAWLRRRIVAPPCESGTARDRLELRATATDAEAFWNGESVGRHLGGWTRWSVPLSRHDDGRLDGLFELRLDEKAGHDTQGFLTIIQPHFGGAWQEVVHHVAHGPTVDTRRLLTFGDGAGRVLRAEVPVRAREGDGPLDVSITLERDGVPIVQSRHAVVADGEAAPTRVELSAPDVDLWAPGAPALYDVRIELHPQGEDRVLDRVERRVGFRHVSRDGTRLLWNGAPLQVRGMLHWGYSPPGFAPTPNAERWRRDLESMRDLGCNLVKCCLWIPPTSYYDVADELGVLVWQEAPTWHAQLTLDRLPQLRAEFAEFCLHDRNHPSVAFRSITCETGADVDKEVLETLYHDTHAAVPNSLVIDNSSWISWMHIHDFWDDHPYGNNGWWPGKLEEFKAFIAEREAMPLLFGECIASDTWFDDSAWLEEVGETRRWDEPWCLDAQRVFESDLRTRWGEGVVERLIPVSTRYAFRNRKYQCERLRLTIPDAGYVLSVIRDFPKARMGFIDDLERRKWSPEEWSWHRDTMLCLETKDDRRAFLASEDVVLPVRVSHFGDRRHRGRLELSIDEVQNGDRLTRDQVDVRPGNVHEGSTLRLKRDRVAALLADGVPRKVRLQARLVDDLGDQHAVNAWDLWLLPDGPQAETGTDTGAAPVDAAADSGPQLLRALTPDAIDALRKGSRALLVATPTKHSFKTSNLWYLRGAPWAPPHPLHARVSRALLEDLQGFDLEQPFVLHGQALADQVHPILGFWDTHDLREVKQWLFAFETRVGEGRLLVSAFDHETPAGQWLQAEFLHHLEHGPAPEATMDAEMVEGLIASMSAERLDLATWRFRTDPADEGDALGWSRGDDTVEGWRDMPAGRHWEAEGVQHDGVAWYATTFDCPESWIGQRVHAVFEGVDDSYHLYCNGTLVAQHGDPATGETVWLIRTTGELTDAMQPGLNRLVLRVVDHTGAGGMHRPAFLTTGPAHLGVGVDLLNE